MANCIGVTVIELWVDKLDGRGLRQMFFEPHQRAEAADFAREAILRGWRVQCV